MWVEPSPIDIATTGTCYALLYAVTLAACTRYVRLSQGETLNSSSSTDNNLVTAAAWPAHPQFVRQFVFALGGRFENVDKKILFLCGDFMEDYEIMVPFQALVGIGYQVLYLPP
jgi:D-lactate dehydratase